MRPPCKRATAAQIASPSPVPLPAGSSWPRKNFLNTSRSWPAARPGPSSATMDASAPRRSSRARRSCRLRACGASRCRAGSPATARAGAGRTRRWRRRLTCTRSRWPREPRAEGRARLLDQVIGRAPLAAAAARAPSSMRVRSSRSLIRRMHALRLAEHAVEQHRAVRRVERLVLLQQARRRADDRRQRRAEVVRDARQQGAAQPFGLGFDDRLRALALEAASARARARPGSPARRAGAGPRACRNAPATAARPARRAARRRLQQQLQRAAGASAPRAGAGRRRTGAARASSSSSPPTRAQKPAHRAARRDRRAAAAPRRRRTSIAPPSPAPRRCPRRTSRDELARPAR